MNGSNRTITAICGGFLALSVTVQTASILGSGGPVTSRELSRLRNHQTRIGTVLVGRASTLRIKNVRLEAAPRSAQKPSAVLRFDMVNEGSLTLTDVLVEIAILKREPPDSEVVAPRVIVGPFTIRGHLTIDSGYTMNYDMLLRNFSADCECVANVVVVSARAAADSSS